jgi:hypothetical protein
MILRERWKSASRVSKTPVLRLHVNVKRSLFASSFLTPIRSSQNLAIHKLHVTIIPAATGPGFHWNRLEPDMHRLLLPGGVFSEVSLEQCLAELTQESALDSDNQWNCPKCAIAVRAQTSIALWAMPPVLIVHLKRFQKIAIGVHRKIESNVIYPDELDLGPFSRDGGRYRLIGVVDHLGCMNSGHYIAKVWESRRQSWYRFSDSLIEQCGPAAVHSQNAYILFYERIEEAPKKTGDGSGEEERAPE